MSYYMNFADLSMEELAIEIKTAYLLPSHKILLDNLDENFEIIMNQGVKNLLDLMELLKTPQKVRLFSIHNDVPLKYLTVLRRLAFSYKPKVHKLANFNIVHDSVIAKLENAKIKNTIHFYNATRIKAIRIKLSKELEIPYEELMKLTKFTDLVRIKWVGPTFARLLYNTGCDTTYKVVNSDPKELYDKLIEYNNTNKVYKGNLGYSDVKLQIDVAKIVPLDIEY